jgi:hypothetical protein
MLGLAKMAAKMAAKKMGKQAAKEADDVPVPNFYQIGKAKEAEKAKDLLKERVAIGVGTVAAAPIAAELGSQYGSQLNERGARIKKEAEKLQKQYEAQDMQEGSGMKKGGKVNKPKQSSASKRADGCAIKGKTRGRMV